MALIVHCDSAAGYRAMKIQRGDMGWSGSAMVLVSLVFSGAAIAQDRPVTLAELGTRVGLSSASISPDGKQIVLVTSRANYAENRFESSLVLVDATNGTQRVLASAPNVGVSSPQ